MPRIAFIGALVYDMVFEVPDWVKPHQAVHASRLTLSPGGKALSQAVAARRLGAEDARLVGCVGADVFGDEMLAALRQEALNIEHVRRLPDARTSVAAIVVQAGAPGFIGAPDASRLVDKAQLQAALAGFGPGDVVAVDFEIPQPLVQYALERARAAGATTVLNPAPFFTRDDFVVHYLPLVDVLIPNQSEARLILNSESDDADDLARGLRQLGAGQIALTLGERGSLLVDDDGGVVQAAFAGEIVDTTGASDAFVGAYCVGLLHGWEKRRALTFASVAAGLACGRRGTMTALPSLEEVRRALHAAMA